MQETRSVAQPKRREGGGLEERFLAATPATRHQYIDVHFLTANVDVVIEHTLRPSAVETVAYEIVQASGPVALYQDLSSTRRAWTQDTIVLRSNVSNVTVRLLLTLTAGTREEGIVSPGVPGATYIPGALNVTGLLTLTAGQIAFPATQVPSTSVNTLDDYEEGLAPLSWTPTLAFGGATTGITYTVQTGYYLKVGRGVFIWGRITLSSKGSATGTATLSGLPFTAHTETPTPTYQGSVGAYAAMAGLTSVPIVRIVGNTTVIDLYDGGAAAAAVLDDTNFTNTTAFPFSISYPASA